MYLIDTKIQCPYCGEQLTIFIEPLEHQQCYVEDCQICCSPILINAEVDAGELVSIVVQKENP